MAWAWASLLPTPPGTTAQPSARAPASMIQPPGLRW